MGFLQIISFGTDRFAETGALGPRVAQVVR